MKTIKIPSEYEKAFMTLLSQGVEYLTQHENLDSVLECDGFEEWFDTI
jgi:hypothetical protein